MSSSQEKLLAQSMTDHLKRSSKRVTILFTDIEKSTRLWDEHGDVAARVMVDRHNRLVFRAVRKYRGKVVKTIGDAVMASFRSPKRAVKAAMAIQQALQEERTSSEGLPLKVRIGVHTGKALVENRDVFGDVVNLAARVESRAKGNEVLVSQATARGLRKKTFPLTERGSFVPKGKKQPVRLYRCRWEEAPYLTRGIRTASLLPMGRRQKCHALLYLAATLGVLLLLYLEYIRYLVADSEPLALLSLNPELFLTAHPVLLGSPVALALLGLIVLISRLKTATGLILGLLKGLKGGYGFCLGFLLVFLPATHLPLESYLSWEKTPLYQSEHLFVEALEQATAVRSRPSADAPVLRRVDAGTLLLLNDVLSTGGVTWNKVLLTRDAYGFVPRVMPARLGAPQTRLSYTKAFSFTLLDICALGAGLLGFLWGALTFRIRPV